jgi:hypothetical protein
MTWYKQRWREMGAAGQTAGYSARGLGTLAQLGNVAGKTLIVADVIGNVYFTYLDMQRFQAGETGGGYLALKTGLRGAQVGLTYYAFVSPELFSKGFAAVAAVVLVTADMATEWGHDVFSAAEHKAARRLLASIDRDERYHAIRYYLAVHNERPWGTTDWVEVICYAMQDDSPKDMTAKRPQPNARGEWGDAHKSVCISIPCR